MSDRVGGCRGSLCCSGLAHGTLSLRLGDVPDSSCTGSCGDLAASSGTVQGKRLPRVSVDTQLVSLLLPSD